MKKNRNVNLFGLVFILAIALVFVGIDFAQGQVETLGKPPGKEKKPNYVWSVVILDDPGFGLKGIDNARNDANWHGWIYDDSESNVNVGVEIRRAPFDGVEKYWTRFYLEIFYPVQVDFNFIPYEAWFYPNTPDALCKYPGDYLSTDPMSMLHFLQDSYHPHPSYEKVYFKFNTDRSVDQNQIDYEQWTYHDHLGFLCDVSGSPPQAYSFVPCEEYEVFEFSHIEFGADNNDDGDYGYFERIGEDVWKVVVGAEIYPPYDYTNGPGDWNAWATDWYNFCVETQFNKNKKASTYDAIFSSQGSLDIKFEILFIRTKQ
ncbi:hypothetical protein ACFLT2_01240 [Acidobacteriota bacterium]